MIPPDKLRGLERRYGRLIRQRSTAEGVRLEFPNTIVVADKYGSVRWQTRGRDDMPDLPPAEPKKPAPFLPLPSKAGVVLPEEVAQERPIESGLSDTPSDSSSYLALEVAMAANRHPFQNALVALVSAEETSNTDHHADDHAEQRTQKESRGLLFCIRCGKRLMNGGGYCSEICAKADRDDPLFTAARCNRE